MASCKNKCSSVYDITGTSADNSTITASQALRLYDSCLVSFSSNDTTPTGQDCSSKYYACSLAGLEAPNVCNADYATCKNDCAVILDTCRSSGDESLVSMCDSLYNGCLDPVMSSNITTNATVAINATSTYVLPTKSAFFNLTGAYSTIVSKASTATASAYISGAPSSATNGTGHYTQATSVSIAAISTGISSGYSLPVVTISASYPLSNATSTSNSIVSASTTSESAITIETGKSGAVDRAVDGNTSDEGDDDDDACET